MHSKSSALFRSKEELNRIAEEISDRGEMDLVLNIAISVAVSEKNGGVNAKISYEEKEGACQDEYRCGSDANQEKGVLNTLKQYI